MADEERRISQIWPVVRSPLSVVLVCFVRFRGYAFIR
jgi:hypothetical protein